jgi:hypothetical protein
MKRDDKMRNFYGSEFNKWWKMSERQVLSLIYQELDDLLPLDDYWESDEHYERSNVIYDWCVGNKIITNEWLYNTTLKHSDDERLVELLSILFKYFRKNLSQHEILDLNDSHNQNT